MIPTNVIVTAPDGSDPLIPLETMKAFLRVDGTEDEALITSLVNVAEERLEDHTGLKFRTQTWDIFFQCFPYKERGNNSWWDGTREGAIDDLYEQADEMELPFGPCQSVTSLNYTPEDGTETAFASENYTVDTKSLRGRIVLKSGQLWPTEPLQRTNGVAVRAVFGFGAAASVPEKIKQAVMMTVAKLYENRGDNTSSEFFGVSGFTIPSTALVLLEPYRRFKVGR